MIKYADITGYKNLGEIDVFSHIYQFVQTDVRSPMLIIIHAYDIETAKVFKGYVFNNTKAWSSVELTDYEKTTLEKYVGEIKQTGFSEFIEDTILSDVYKEYEMINMIKE